MMGASRGLHHTMKSGQVSAGVDLLVNKYSVLISQTSGSLFKVECIMLRQWFARGGGMGKSMGLRDLTLLLHFP